MKTLYFLFFLININSFAQESDTSDTKIGCSKHEAISAKMNFENDLQNHKIMIYLQGGIVSVIKKEDLAFEKEYGINYKDFGCMTPGNISYYERYNYQVFNYLSNKFGKDWKAKLNTNAFGLSKWN